MSQPALPLDVAVPPVAVRPSRWKRAALIGIALAGLVATLAVAAGARGEIATPKPNNDNPRRHHGISFVPSGQFEGY